MILWRGGQAWAFAYLWLPLQGPFESRLWTKHMWPWKHRLPLGNTSLLSMRKTESGLKRSINYSLVFTLHLLDAKLGTFRKEADKSWEENLITRFRPWNVLTQEPREWPDSNVDPASPTWGGMLQIGKGRKGERTAFPVDPTLWHQPLW